MEAVEFFSWEINTFWRAAVHALARLRAALTHTETCLPQGYQLQP